MKTINLSHFLKNTDSNIEGVKLYSILDSHLNRGEVVILEIENDMSLTSSFLNSSLGNIVEKYGYEKIKLKLKIKTTKNQFDRIKCYLLKFNEIYC